MYRFLPRYCISTGCVVVLTEAWAIPVMILFHCVEYLQEFVIHASLLICLTTSRVKLWEHWISAISVNIHLVSCEYSFYSTAFILPR